MPFLGNCCLSEVRTLFVGCGLSSQVALLMARTGFKRFILADGDKVSKSNLNRQAFYLDDIGTNKTIALGEHMRDVAYGCAIKIIPRFVKGWTELEELIEESDVVVNTADADETIYKINDCSRRMGKIEIFPLNLGFGSFFLFFDREEKITLRELGKGEYGVLAYKNILVESLGEENVAKYMREAFYNLLVSRKEAGFPQTGIATYLNASLIVHALVYYLQGGKPGLVNYFDPRKEQL